MKLKSFLLLAPNWLMNLLCFNLKLSNQTTFYQKKKSLGESLGNSKMESKFKETKKTSDIVIDFNKFVFIKTRWMMIHKGWARFKNLHNFYLSCLFLSNLHYSHLNSKNASLLFRSNVCDRSVGGRLRWSLGLDNDLFGMISLKWSLSGDRRDLKSLISSQRASRLDYRLNLFGSSTAKCLFRIL